jgi:hypothetical protein
LIGLNGLVKYLKTQDIFAQKLARHIGATRQLGRSQGFVDVLERQEKFARGCGIFIGSAWHLRGPLDLNDDSVRIERFIQDLERRMGQRHTREGLMAQLKTLRDRSNKFRIW